METNHNNFNTIYDYVTVTETHYHICSNGWTRATRESVTYAHFRDAYEAFVEGRMRNDRRNSTARRDRFSIQLSWGFPVIRKYDHTYRFQG